MAEILATMAVGPLLAMVKEKASSYLLQQYKVMEGMEEQHEVLMRKLPAILDVITDAEMQAAKHREGAKAWLEAVRKVAYQANDVVDEFKYEALRRKARKEGHYRKVGMHVIKLFPSHNRFVFRYKMGNKLCTILGAIEVLIAEMNAFRFEFKPEQQLSMKGRHTDSSIVDPNSMEIASRSRAEDKKKLVDSLVGQGSNGDLTVVPVVGMGGLGKTTLAQLVYNDPKIREHFQLLLWVCVSDNFDVDLLAKTIVEAANATVEKSPLDSLRGAVSGKRYLLVLDDVWNRDASQWEKLKSCLQHGAMGSSVLTTTRDEAIAQLMGTTNKACKLGLLDESIIEQIIKARAFGSKDASPKDGRVEMVGDMAKRCAGSPLAATALGSLLSTKPSVKEWEDVLSRSTICDEETGILPILKLSYNALPSQMRQCFSFCALFPKDYEIDRDMLIQLWIANGFILEEQGVCPEIRGKQIFTELGYRSFFQDVKEIPLSRYHDDLTIDRSTWIDRSKHGYCCRMTCKIHDLMHDVAESAMGKECAAITTKPSKSEDFPYSSRHLFVPLDCPETILNGFLEERSPALQTLLCTGYAKKELKYLSRYNSVRALRIGSCSFLRPKYLHHLRYLDLSGSDIEALPEDLSILFHLQTLNLSDCFHLAQLPKGMKYMTALRHLYTHGCRNLKMMPPELGCLTSLQTLTCFVAGTTRASCSNVGELRLLDLGDQLQVHQLENVIETDAREASLGNKKRLTELTLTWTDPNREPQHQHHKVLEGLKPHDGIKFLKIVFYGGSTFPTWINTLQHMVELVLCGCNNLEKLPRLWQLPALQVLYMRSMKNLHCLCSGDPPFTFKKLKELRLYEISNLEMWWDISEVQGQDLIFPKVEKLLIKDCKELTALPRASVVTAESSDLVSTEWRSAFPALKELELVSLTSFQRWEADEGTVGENITFPLLGKLLIKDCRKLTTLPEAPKLSELEIEGSSREILLHAARYIPSLSTLKLSADDRGTAMSIDHSLIKLVDYKEKRSHESSLRVLALRACNFLCPPSSTSALWNCLVQLEDLRIDNCDALVEWPENVFQGLVSLRTLSIWSCGELTGCAPERSVLPPRLESLVLDECASLVEVPILPASLRELQVYKCGNLESVIVRKQQNTTRLGSSSSEATTVPNVPEDPRFAPPTTAISICHCPNLLSLSVQLDCTKLLISGCKSLESLANLPPSLECLSLRYCGSLESIPSGPQAYSSLTYLEIESCPHLKVLPPCLKQRLKYMKDEDLRLDACYTDPTPSRLRTCIGKWKHTMSRHH